MVGSGNRRAGLPSDSSKSAIGPMFEGLPSVLSVDLLSLLLFLSALSFVIEKDTFLVFAYSVFPFQQESLTKFSDPRQIFHQAFPRAPPPPAPHPLIRLDELAAPFLELLPPPPARQPN